MAESKAPLPSLAQCITKLFSAYSEPDPAADEYAEVRVDLELADDLKTFVRGYMTDDILGFVQEKDIHEFDVKTFNDVTSKPCDIPGIGKWWIQSKTGGLGIWPGPAFRKRAAHIGRIGQLDRDVDPETIEWCKTHKMFTQYHFELTWRSKNFGNKEAIALYQRKQQIQKYTSELAQIDQQISQLMARRQHITEQLKLTSQ
jgi:hypothetical protein